MAKKKENEVTLKRCYKCRERKPTTEMEVVGVWICKKCLKKMKIN